MIKRLLLIAIATAFCLQTNAQSEFSREWNIGVGVGPTFSSMSIVPTNDVKSLKTKNLSQFHGGISVRYISEKRLGLIGELNFSQQGWESEFEDGSTHKYTNKLNYIELPLLTHIYFGSDKLRVFFNLGPKLGYLLSEKQELNEALQSWINDFDTEITTPPNDMPLYGKTSDKKLDYGIMAGMGMELRTGIGNFALEGRYYMGFGDIYKSSKKDDFSRSANRVISARLTYFIKVF